jgi:poly-gamma-glutamate capsule biosynthesis protein CapA/YwtB (metallophosphatase superfamily)
MSDDCYKSSIIGIVGHGPHLLQKTASINGRPCVYSLGDTLVRSKRPVSKGNPRALSGILRVQLADGVLSSFQMIPVLQEHAKEMITLVNPDTDDARARFNFIWKGR